MSPVHEDVSREGTLGVTVTTFQNPARGGLWEATTREVLPQDAPGPEPIGSVFIGLLPSEFKTEEELIEDMKRIGYIFP